MTAQPLRAYRAWLSHVQRCQRCETVCVESPAGPLVFERCPTCGSTAKMLELIDKFTAKMMEASGDYDGVRHLRDGYNRPFWIEKTK